MFNPMLVLVWLFLMPSSTCPLPQAKFGISGVAQGQMEMYTAAVLLATLRPPSPPRVDCWRKTMDALSASSCDAYRSVVVDHPHFLAYFRHATPESELGNLNIGECGGDM